MSVDLTISETLDGAQAADALAGGGTGVDLGQVQNGVFAPVSLPASNNQGRQDLFIRHNATVDQITDVKLYIDDYATATGFTYGGPGTRSSAADYSSIKTLGQGSGSSETNADGLSGGLWLEMEVVTMITETNQFKVSTRPTLVKIFGDSGTDGIDVASAFVIQSEAMVIDSDTGNGGNGTAGYIPTAPVDGEIGLNGSTVLGDNAHIGQRIFLPSAFTDGGIFQVALTTVYTFTA